MGFTQCIDLMCIIVYVVVTDNGDYLHWLPGGALMRFYEAISGNAMHGLTMAVGLARSPLTVGFARIFPWRLKGQPTGALAAADGKKQKQNINRDNLFWHFFHFIVRLADWNCE